MSVRRSRISANKQYIRVWFNYLQVALNQKLKVNREFYRKWHLNSIEQGIRFNDWWKEHEHHFTIKTLHTIRIDTRLSMNEALKECKKKLEGRVGQTSEFKITSNRFRYVEVDDYLKILKRRLKGRTHQAVAFDIEHEYFKKDEKYKNNKNLLKRKMQRVGHDIKTKGKYVDRMSMRRVSKAKKILDNVAFGVFPGVY